MKTAIQASSKSSSELIMRKTCSCGRPMGPSGECAECQRKRQPGGTVQTKLRVNRPGDKYEQEADRVAEQVMRMPEQGVQRQAEDEEDEEELLQTKPLNQRQVAGNGKGSEAPSIVQEALRSPGRPLAESTRAFMESRFGHSFSDVRIHTGSRAATSAQAVGARAYTVGRDIVFGAGEFTAGTSAGRRLLAHELTHVVQQTGPSTLQRQDNNTIQPFTEVEEQEDAVVPEESERAEISAEPTGPFHEVRFVSKDQAPEEETDTPVTNIAAASAGLAPTIPAHQLIPQDHPSEREAEAVSQAIVSSSENGILPKISRFTVPGAKLVQRKIIYWEERNTLTWNDFKGTPPNGTKWDATVDTGFIAPKGFKSLARWTPWPKKNPTKCKDGKQTTTNFLARVQLDPKTYNVRAQLDPATSWVKSNKKVRALLRHEQGHFDIANVIGEKTERAIIAWSQSKSGYRDAKKCGKEAAVEAADKAYKASKPEKTINKILSNGDSVYKTAQQDYENNTGHGANSKEQSDWGIKIAGDLKDYQIKIN